MASQPSQPDDDERAKKVEERTSPPIILSNGALALAKNSSPRPRRGPSQRGSERRVWPAGRATPSPWPRPSAPTSTTTTFLLRLRVRLACERDRRGGGRGGAPDRARARKKIEEGGGGEGEEAHASDVVVVVVDASLASTDGRKSGGGGGGHERTERDGRTADVTARACASLWRRAEMDRGGRPAVGQRGGDMWTRRMRAQPDGRKFPSSSLPMLCRCRPTP